MTQHSEKSTLCSHGHQPESIVVCTLITVARPMMALNSRGIAINGTSNRVVLFSLALLLPSHFSHEQLRIGDRSIVGSEEVRALAAVCGLRLRGVVEADMAGGGCGYL